MEPNRAACAIPYNLRNLRQQLRQPALFSWLREDDRYVEAAFKVLPHRCNLRRRDMLDDLAIWEFLLAVFGDEELIAVGILESLDVRNVLLVDCGESQRHKQDVWFAQVVEFADELADGTVAVLQFGHLNAVL